MQTFALSKEKYLPDLVAKRVLNLIRPELGLVAAYERQTNSTIQVIELIFFTERL